MRALEPLASLPLDDKIVGVVEAGFAVFMRHRGLKRALFPHAYRLQRVRHVIEARNVLAKVLADLFREHAAEFNIENVDRAAYVLSHAIQGLLQTVLVSPEPLYSDEELKSEIVRMVRGYLREGASKVV